MVYPFYLIYNIYKNGFIVLFDIIKGSVKPKMVRVRINLKTGFAAGLLANSITLTPGTITVDKNSDELYVLFLDSKKITKKGVAAHVVGRYEYLIGGRVDGN